MSIVLSLDCSKPSVVSNMYRISLVRHESTRLVKRVESLSYMARPLQHLVSITAANLCLSATVYAASSIAASPPGKKL